MTLEMTLRFENELRALNARFIRNFVTNDVASHDAIIHAEFLCLMPNGAWLNRDAYLAYWATAFDPRAFSYFDYRDESIAVFGNVGLVRSTTKFIRRANGADRTGMNAYTDTYVREHSEWKCIQAQLTPVSAEHYPNDDTIVQAWVNGRLKAA